MNRIRTAMNRIWNAMNRVESNEQLNMMDNWTRAVDPNSFFADPDPAAKKMRIQIQLNKICDKLLYEVLK